jgi:hypothetical protein
MELHSPYRTPAAPSTTKQRIERLELRRYTRAYQLLVLIWLPLVALLAKEAYPTTDLVCAQASCELESRTLLHQASEPIAGVVATRSGGLRVVLRGGEAHNYDMGWKEARAVESDFHSAHLSDAATNLRSVDWFVSMCGLGELLLLAYLVVAQSFLRLEVDLGSEAGTVRIQARGTFRIRREMTIAFDDITAFGRVGDGARQIVYAFTHGPGKRELFAVTNPRARIATDFLSDARKRWLRGVA